MRIEVTVAKTTALPAGAIDALTQELTKRIDKHFPDGSNTISVRYASANNLTVMGEEKKQRTRLPIFYRKPGRVQTTGLRQIKG